MFGQILITFTLLPHFHNIPQYILRKYVLWKASVAKQSWLS
jgi:hypothetical protein